jgi:hypothetical protein
VQWARRDLNPGPRDYESPALTAELQARVLRQDQICNDGATCGQEILGLCAKYEWTRGGKPRIDFRHLIADIRPAAAL